MDLSNKKQLEEAIKNGLPCYYQYGFTFKGAGKRRMMLNKIIRILGETINHTNSKLLDNIYYILIKISRL